MGSSYSNELNQQFKLDLENFYEDYSFNKNTEEEGKLYMNRRDKNNFVCVFMRSMDDFFSKEVFKRFFLKHENLLEILAYEIKNQGKKLLCNEGISHCFLYVEFYEENLLSEIQRRIEFKVILFFNKKKIILKIYLNN